MIADFCLLEKGTNVGNGYTLPVMLLNGQKYNVYPSIIPPETNISIGAFNFQKGCEYLLFRRKEFSLINMSIESIAYSPQNNFNYSTFKIESLESLKILHDTKLEKIVGTENVFYQLIPV